jgi:hypothetical protein
MNSIGKEDERKKWIKFVLEKCALACHDREREREKEK